MAAGSGRVLADIVSGRRAEFEAADLGYARYLREGRKGRAPQGGLAVPA
jgi:D-amino-acid dehydrogenase